LIIQDISCNDDGADKEYHLHLFHSWFKRVVMTTAPSSLYKGSTRLWHLQYFVRITDSSDDGKCASSVTPYSETPIEI
jgi:hypothetical protein